MIQVFKNLMVAAVVASVTPAIAQDAPQDPNVKLGRETGLPIPRYISLKSGESNMRRGPATDYPIDWVYHRRGLPVQVIGESGHWRKVIDNEGYKGWLHYALLSGNRTVLITADDVTMHKNAAQNARIVAKLESGVIANLEGCVIDWCQVETSDIEGWIPKSTIWGVDTDEVFED